MDTNEQEQEEVVVQEENTTTETEAEETEQSDDTVTLSKSEFTKLKRQAIAYKSTKETSKPRETEVTVSPDRLERIELMQEGYSKEEADAIMDLGGQKTLSNPLVKGAIEQMRKKAKSEDANQNLSSRSPVYKKYTQEDLSKMSSKELEAILPRD